MNYKWNRYREFKEIIIKREKKGETQKEIITRNRLKLARKQNSTLQDNLKNIQLEAQNQTVLKQKINTK